MTCPNCTNPECDGLCVGGSRSVPEQKPTNQTTMTTALLTRALEALDWCADLSQTTLNHTSLHETRAAIRAHLEAQPAPQSEPLIWECKAGGLKRLSQRLYGLQPDKIKRHYTRIQPAPHPPSRHCMCDACKPSFVDDTQPAVAQAVGEVDAVREGGEFHVAFSCSLPLGTKLYTAAPAQTAPQALTDDQVESLIDESDGRWHDGEFRIDGPDLTRLLRAAHGITALKGTT